GFTPAHVAQQHLAGEDDRPRVHHVLVGVLGRGAVGGFEHGVAGDEVDVAAGRDANTADLSGQGVGEIVAVQVHGGEHVKVGGTRDGLLEDDVCDDILEAQRAGL